MNKTKTNLEKFPACKLPLYVGSELFFTPDNSFNDNIFKNFITENLELLQKDYGAFIVERQAMTERKSVNDIIWHRTWNHLEGNQLDLPQWISYPDILHVIPIPENDIPIQENDLPNYLPQDNPISEELLRGLD